MIPSETIQARAAIKEAGVLIRKLDSMMKDPWATPQRLAELKHYQEALIANNLGANAETIRLGIKFIEDKLKAETKAVEAARPRTQQDIIDEQTRLYKASHAKQKRFDKNVTDNGHLNRPK